MRLGLYDEAVASLTASCDASPETSDVPRSLLAVAYILRGDVELALSELRPLFDKLPTGNAGLCLALTVHFTR
jgi:hypothetical protein